jgi:hypothetical protein
MMRMMNMTCCMSALAERSPWNGNRGADRYTLRGAEEAGDDADGGEHSVEAVDVVDEQKEETEAGAEEVAGDERGFDGPAVDEDAADDADERDGEQVGDLDAGDLLRRGVQLEGHVGDDREEGEEVAEGGDDLRVPEAAHGDDAEDGAHGFVAHLVLRVHIVYAILTHGGKHANQHRD